MLNLSFGPKLIKKIGPADYLLEESSGRVLPFSKRSNQTLDTTVSEDERQGKAGARASLHSVGDIDPGGRVGYRRLFRPLSARTASGQLVYLHRTVDP